MKWLSQFFEGVPLLLSGDPESVLSWTDRWDWRRLVGWGVLMGSGSALFGASMGWWRAPEQALFTAVKFPVVGVVTMLGNALLNAIVAPLLGVNIGFRRSLLAVMMASTIASVVLGGMSPLLVFLIHNVAPLEEVGSGGEGHAVILLSLVAMVAFAGVAANVRLFQLLTRLSGSSGAALKVLLAWLGGNLLLGSQVSWMLRPFIGSPGLPVQFLRPDWLQGSFFEAVLFSIRQVLNS